MTREEVLAIFDRVEADELTTAELAESLDLSRPAAWNTLDELAGEHLIERHVGRGLKSDTWSITADGMNLLRQRRE